tara:strand:- start:4568 stop:5764 length:1197 start_codon:yes stop_codon:yes gene_type:complete
MKDWERKSLGEVCEIVNGSTPLRSNKKFWENGNFPWFTIDDIREQGRIISHTKQKVTEAALSKLRVLPVDTVLLCCTASVGEYAITKIELTTNQQFNGLVLKDRKKLDPEFLMHYCSTLKDKLLGLSGKTTIDFIAISKLKPLEIPLPPLPEQQRIVAILDEAFAAIDKAKANAEQNLQNAKELFESYLQGVFEKKGDDWEEKTLGELCTFTQGIQRGVKLQSETQEKGQVRFLRIVDYTQGNEPPRYIDFPGDKYVLNEEDVALVRYGASTGFVCQGMIGALANNLFRVIPKSHEALSNNFLAVYLRSTVFQNVIKATMNGAAMPAISFGLIKEIPFPFPNLEEQQIIIRKLSAVQSETQKLEAMYQKKINDLEELKKSILQKAFAGELETEKAVTV